MGVPLDAVCIQCGASRGVSFWFTGCPECASENARSNLTLTYDYDKIPRETISQPPGGHGASLWRFHPLLPVEEAEAVSLGEGGTPLLPANRLGEDIGCGELWLKDESRNPTGSFKDRLCAVVVAKARAASARTVAVSSTGNQGASLAAYAAAAGLECVVLTLRTIPEPLRVAAQVTGAHVVALPQPSDRWVVLREGVEQEGWFPASNYVSPPVGSNFYGIEGYKTIAYEIWEQLGGRVPGTVVIPTCYGDGLYGIWKGFEELRKFKLADRTPRMVAAEVSGWLSRSLEAGVPWEEESRVTKSAAFNLLTSRSTYQGLAAIQASGGTALQMEEEEILAMQRSLARAEGLYTEASSAVGLAALRRLKEAGYALPEGGTVAVLTSTGLKDPSATGNRLPGLKVAEPTLRSVLETVGVAAVRGG